MINSNMKAYVVKDNVETLDQLGQVSFSYKPLYKVECSIFLQEQHNVDGDVRYREATHTGITKDKRLKKGQRLSGADGEFEIILVPQTKGRFTTLVLKEVI